jgi:putative peptide zinc metalloprotease protein
LLRFDGYYILSDLLGVPNLGQEASAAMRGEILHWFLGVELPGGPRRRRLLLSAYALSSAAYRCLVMAGFVWLVLRLSKSFHLEFLGWAASGAVVGMLLSPLLGTVQTAFNPSMASQFDGRRFALRGAIALLTLIGVLVCPLPYRVDTPVTIEAADARRIYVSVPGTLVEALSAGTSVEKGQTIARLENLELQLEIQQLRSRLSQQRLHVQNLSSRRVTDPQAAALLPAATEGLADLERRVRQRSTDGQRLTLTAPAAGIVLPPPRRNLQQEPGALIGWSGTPLDSENRRAFLETGTLVCLVGDPRRLQAMLMIDQAEIEFVEVGEHVTLCLDETPGEFLEGTITEVAEDDSQIGPRQFEAAGPTASLSASGNSRARVTAYRARVEFALGEERLLLGGQGRAKIAVPSRSLGWRLYRFLSRTFRVDL